MRRLRRSMQVSVLAVLAAGAAAHAQPAPIQPQPSIQDTSNAFMRFFRDGEWYFSWGYNKEYWAPTDIHVSQPSLGNNFTIHGVQGADEFSFPEIFSPSLFGPQYNIRIGRFINDERTIGVEFSLDHTKYTTVSEPDSELYVAGVCLGSVRRLSMIHIIASLAKPSAMKANAS